MTDGLRIAHLGIAPQWAILRWAILRVIKPNTFFSKISVRKFIMGGFSWMGKRCPGLGKG